MPLISPWDMFTTVPSNDQFIAFRDLPFPLNLYACCSFVDTGQIQRLFSGFNLKKSAPVYLAKHDDTDLVPLSDTLPAALNAIFVVQDFGKMFHRYQKLRYSIIELLTEQGRLVDLMHLPTDPRMIASSDFESFEESLGQWDLIFLQGIIDDIDLLAFFNHARRLLRPLSGRIVYAVASANRLYCCEPDVDLPTSTLRLASRLGFELVETRDLSETARFSCEYAVELLSKHQGVLMEDFGFTEQQILELSMLNSQHKDAYLAGKKYFQLFMVQMVRQPPQIPGWVRTHHFVQFSDLFRRAFDAPLSRQLWDWKYGDGRGQAIGVWEDGVLIAHYGGVTRRVMYFGEAQLASQSADVMTLPSSRRSLVRKSAFFLSAATYLELTTGFGRRHLLGFGFPNERARRAPELLGLYSKPVSKMYALTWSLDLNDWRILFLQHKELDLSVRSDAALVDDCWSRMASETEGFVIGIRDRDWIVHRYVNHPHQKYVIYAVSVLGRSMPFGVIVIKKHSDDLYELMDIIAKPKRIKWILSALTGIVNGANTKFFTWISEPLRAFFPAHYETRDLQIGIPSCVWTHGPEPKMLLNRWWLMGGDTDFL